MAARVSAHSLFLHDVNEQGFRVLTKLGFEEGDFACECSHKGCIETIHMTLREYAARDGEPLIIPAHRSAS